MSSNYTPVSFPVKAEKLIGLTSAVYGQFMYSWNWSAEQLTA